VHRISTYKEGQKMTTTTDRSELLATLSEGIAKLTTSDEWQRYLDCQSRFYRYSPNNVMLIAQQRHEATMVAGFNAWRKHGRFVRKGEKASLYHRRVVRGGGHRGHDGAGALPSQHYRHFSPAGRRSDRV